MNLKFFLIVGFVATFTLNAFAAPNVPLNKYGAVNVNANIPDDVQVPLAPASFKAPVINPVAKKWVNNDTVLVPAPLQLK